MMAMDMSYMMSLLGFITLIRGFLPPELNDIVQKWWDKLIRPVNPFCNFFVPENDASGMNDFYRVVQMHIRAAKLSREADQLILSREENGKEITYNLAGGESVADTFEGVTVWWTHTQGKVSSDKFGTEEREENQFTLKMRKRDKEFVMSQYLEHVTESAAEHRRQLRELYLYSNSDSYWECHTFKHPSTFDTLAMEPELKAKVKADLHSFMHGEKFFRKVGRAWKRGYLLYGPPGTGKSSMIAAMANHLKYNIYDLELTQVYNNNALKQLLVNTTSKSIIVIEDIDCSLDLSGQRKTDKPATEENNANGSDSMTSKVTLSGLLNFTDGLWSCCGDERIIIFTTNHIEKLDAALLRPGRMDMHIHMSFCSFETFKVLASNYLSIDSHPLYSTVKGLLETGVLITPAQVTEVLFGDRDDPDAAIAALIERLEKPEEMPEETKTPGTVVTEDAEKEVVEISTVDTKDKSNNTVEKESAVDLRKKVKSLEEKVELLERKTGEHVMDATQLETREKEVALESGEPELNKHVKTLEMKVELLEKKNGGDVKHPTANGVESKAAENGKTVGQEGVASKENGLKEYGDVVKENGLSLENIVDEFTKSVPNSTFPTLNGVD